MEIKQKHGKHALRKAVTAAVLAGTAFSTFSGLTVFAHERNEELVSSEIKNIQDFIIKKRVEREVDRKSDEVIVSEIRDFLKGLSSDTLHKLISHMDEGRYDYPYGELHTYSRVLQPFRNDNGDWRQNSLSLVSLVIEEIQNRIVQNERRGKEISEKEAKIEEYSQFEKELKKYNKKLEKSILENNKKN